MLQALCKTIYETSGKADTCERAFSPRNGDDEHSSYSLLGNYGQAACSPTSVPLVELISYLVGGRGGSAGHDFVDVIATLKTRSCRATLRSVAFSVLRSILCATSFDAPMTEVS